MLITPDFSDSTGNPRRDDSSAESCFYEKPIGAHNTSVDKSATSAAAIFLSILILNRNLEQVAYHLVGQSFRPRGLFSRNSAML